MIIVRARGIRPAAFCGLLLVAATARGARDADAPAENSAPAAADWVLERVTLTDGRVYQGLVESENPASIEFAEVRRPRGKPMFVIVRPIDRKAIASWERLPGDQRKTLRARLEKYKHRALIEGRRMEDLALTATRDDGLVVWEYQGNWFTLESTADESMTRRSIVRLEQIFTAYRQILPPRRTASEKIHVRIFGATEQYRQALAQLGLGIKNPAVFLADKNVILAGSDLNRFDAELAQIARQHQQIKLQLDALVADTPARLKQLGEELKQNDLAPAERQKILLAEQKKWEDQRKTARRKIAALDRKNAAKFNEVSGQMFTRLAHEAFHAYLETFVFPRQQFDVPRWLNEGLAQAFEGGLLEADTFRLDTPNTTALAHLQADLRGPQPLDLSELLNAGSDAFLAAHSGDTAIASRLYFYSWGLAYYLAFDESVLETSALDAYLNPTAAAKPAVERFEAFVAQPLSEFQPRWREAMLKLTAAP